MKNSIIRNKLLLTLACALTILTSACGMGQKASGAKVAYGPTRTTEIQILRPGTASESVDVELKFLAGELTLAPGEGKNLASGTATFNATEFEPKVVFDGSKYSMIHGGLKKELIPSIGKDLINKWDIQIADAPMNLKIWAGAYTGRFELGGLSLKNLTVDEQGSDMVGSFSEPNHVVMSTFNYSTGGSSMELTGLANANFEQMIFNSGAGTYTLSFDGELQRDAQVTIETGASTVNLIIPEGVNAQVTFDGGLSAVVPEGAWVKDGDMYSLTGDGPTITIAVKMGLGTLNLKTS